GAGGMVQYAIPGFRLTSEAFDQDLRRILSLGVRLHYGTRIDEKDFRALRERVHYLFVGAGAQLPSSLTLEGMDADGVIDPLSFLMRVKNGEPAGIGKQVLIIGGGNTAMDAARTAFRLVGEDGKVTIVYRRTIREMPADQGEIKAVLEEGVEVLELTGPECVLAEQGRVKALRCYKMVLSDADESGRPRPVPLPGSEFELACDTIIPAVGQELDIDFVDQTLLKADPGGFMTRIDNVFIGGDAMRGASTAINAIGDGRKAAGEIMKQAFFDFQIDMPSSARPYSLSALMVKRARREFGPKIPELPLDDRRNFKLVQQPLEEKAVVREAARCLSCDELCNSCTTVCPNFANYAYQVEPEQVNLQKAVRVGRSDEVRIVFDKVFEICQSTQILNIANFCNECGNCTTFCPTASAPYKEKPRLHLSIPSFYGSDEGYYLSLHEGRKTLIYKQKESHTILSETETEYIFETDEAIARLDKNNFSIKEVKFSSPEGNEVNLRQAACMKVIMKGAVNFYPPINYNPGF
ncbi:MAG: FAD-dependent oxidoreductase, partial [Bacteroidales bacterium]